MGTDVKCITDTKFNFSDCTGSILLDFELYCNFKGGEQGYRAGTYTTRAFTKISNLNSDAYRTEKSLAKPTEHGHQSSLTGYKLNHIFLIGGFHKTSLATVEVYRVDRDEWSSC